MIMMQKSSAKTFDWYFMFVWVIESLSAALDDLSATEGLVVK
jgi:hypothetical protein